MSGADTWRELAPLAALGALDGEEQRTFAQHATSCPDCQGDLAAHQAVVGQIGLATPRIAPPPGLRRRVLGAVDPALVAPPAHTTKSLPAWLPLAAVLVLALPLGFLWMERSAARQELAAARQRIAAQQQAAQSAEQSLQATRAALQQQQGLQALLGQPTSRVSALAGLPAAPTAHGKVVWNPGSREAVLTASGLPAAGPGKLYVAWVIAEGAPVSAGSFEVDAQGQALLRLPVRDETARARTFAVTLEPSPGGPAPTGPMVLAGATS